MLLRNPQSPLVTTGDSPMLGANPRRVALIVSAPVAGTLYLSLWGPAVVGQGIAIPAGTPALKLDADLYGEVFREEVRGIMSGAAQTIGIIEIFH